MWGSRASQKIVSSNLWKWHKKTPKQTNKQTNNQTGPCWNIPGESYKMKNCNNCKVSASYTKDRATLDSCYHIHLSSKIFKICNRSTGWKYYLCTQNRKDRPNPVLICTWATLQLIQRLFVFRCHDLCEQAVAYRGFFTPASLLLAHPPQGSEFQLQPTPFCSALLH